MIRWLERSLPARVGFAVSLIALLGLFSMISASVIAWRAESDAAAINTAGSLRMVTYRLSWKIEARADAASIRALADDLEHRLQSPALASSAMNGSILDTYHDIQRLWHDTLRPAIDRGDTATFNASADHFVSDLDAFVLRLQKISERRQAWQQTVQGTALVLTILILLAGMRGLQRNIITPLRELVSANHRFRSGDLETRVTFQSQDELGQLAESFNSMADAIMESHRTLERRVEEKTRSLAQSNAALQLLYMSSRNFAYTTASARQLDELIQSFQERLPGLHLTLCLYGHEDGQDSPHLLVIHGDASRQICDRRDCDTCGRRMPVDGRVVTIHSQGDALGELRSHYDDRHSPEPWELELIETLANLIGTSLSLERQREQNNRLLLLDERTTIARELHDSLAQALSFMKLQVSRLQMLARRNESPETLERVADELREGINSAYRQLRELLNTFRLQIQDGDLDRALEETAHEFAERGDFTVDLRKEPLTTALSATEQIHILQIVREALSNCARHANAKHVHVQLRQAGEDIYLLIEDDGCGIINTVDQRQHHGMSIMQERARRINGHLGISPRTPSGTRISLQFRPEFLSQ